MMSATAWTSLKVTMLCGKSHLQTLDPGTPLLVWRFRNRLAMQGSLVPSLVTELTSHKQLQESVHHGERLLSDRSKVPRATAKTQCCCCCSVAQLWPTLWDPHGLQHARLPCPSPFPGACSDSCPLSQGCHPTVWCSAWAIQIKLNIKEKAQSCAIAFSRTFQPRQNYRSSPRIVSGLLKGAFWGGEAGEVKESSHASQDGCYPEVYKQ